METPTENQAGVTGRLPDAVCSLFLLPISKEPRPGQRVIVHLKDGNTRECTATLMHTHQGIFTQYFRRRRAIDINQIAGWTTTENAKSAGTDASGKTL